MLVAIRDYALKNGIPAQLSVESYMGCGVGLCQGCIISKNNKSQKDNSYHEQYSLVCLDGPIYEAEDIKFEQS
jgi:dihydroorotate dehydrogenase electron transfer subunit